jgi:hypothetical protein
MYYVIGATTKRVNNLKFSRIFGQHSLEMNAGKTCKLSEPSEETHKYPSTYDPVDIAIVKVNLQRLKGTMLKLSD